MPGGRPVSLLSGRVADAEEVGENRSSYFAKKGSWITTVPIWDNTNPAGVGFSNSSSFTDILRDNLAGFAVQPDPAARFWRQ